MKFAEMPTSEEWGGDTPHTPLRDVSTSLDLLFVAKDFSEIIF